MSTNILSCPFLNDKKITELDLLDPNTRSNPYPYYEWLREEEDRRIYRLPQEKMFYVVHKHEDVKSVLTNHKDFINQILPTKNSPFFALMDGENHLRIREVVSKIFSKKIISTSQTKIDKNIEAYTKNMLLKKDVELFKEWANPIPLSTLCVVFGLEPKPDLIEKIHHQAILINRALFVLGGTGPRGKRDPNFIEKIAISFAVIKNGRKLYDLYRALGSKGMGELKEMFIPTKTNLETPRPDFKQLPKAITPLFDLMLMFINVIKSEKKESPTIELLKESILKKEISSTEGMMLCVFIMFAGYETTTSLLSNCVAHISQNPLLHADLKNNPEKIDVFIEEALRVYTPVGRFIRRANKDVYIANQLIPKDSLVIVMLGAANTDPDVFESPFSFSVDRKNLNQHISFGKGIHYCSGVSLARYQIKKALLELIKYTSFISLNDSYELKMVTDRDNGILRYEELYLTIE